MGDEKQEKLVVHGPGYLRIKHSGFYDLQTLLHAAKGWFDQHRYIPVEKEHTESPKSSGKELKIVWEPFRNVTEYIRFSIEFEIVILRQVDVVVEKDGKTIPLQQGDLEVRMKSTMMKNYRSTFRGKGKEFTRQTYEKYLMKRELEGYKEKLLAEGDDLLETVKQVLGSFKR